MQRRKRATRPPSGQGPGSEGGRWRKGGEEAWCSGRGENIFPLNSFELAWFALNWAGINAGADRGGADGTQAMPARWRLLQVIDLFFNHEAILRC